ncbi:MAG: hypothetical protein WD226_00115 [Planctomycetota bacterium]
MALATLFCLATLALGVLTAWLARENQARAAELDDVQHACDHLTLENERVRYEIAHAERALFARFLDGQHVEVSR